MDAGYPDNADLLIDKQGRPSLRGVGGGLHHRGVAGAGERGGAKEIHADTQGQSFPVFGLAHLFGVELLPRIRNFRDLTFHRPEPGVRYRHIDALFGEPVNWRLIEDHWQDLMKVAISIGCSSCSVVRHEVAHIE